MALLDKIASLGVGEIAKGIGSLAVNLRTAITGDLPPDKKFELEKIAAQLEMVGQQTEVAVKELQANVIMTEAKGQSWLQRNWRPLLMAIFGVIVANNYIMFPYIELFLGKQYAVKLIIPENMWGLLKLGVSGYIVGRSCEKIADGDGIKGMLKKIIN